MSENLATEAPDTATPPPMARTERPRVPASVWQYLHACPLCANADLAHYCRVRSLFVAGEHIRYERCRACGVVLRNPRLPPSERLARYEDGELSAEQTALKPKNQAHYRHMVRVIRRELTGGSGQRFFDFGCGAGGFLLTARDAGFDVHGLELSRDLALHVERTHGIPVHQGLVGDEELRDERFDVIVASQVFEHLLEPRATLAALRGLLAPRGMLLIEVPNLLAMRERLRRGTTMDDSHLFYFCRRSLPRLLEAEGFEILRVQDGLRPYRFLASYRPTVPVALYEGVASFLSALQIKTGLSVLARIG